MIRGRLLAGMLLALGVITGIWFVLNRSSPTISVLAQQIALSPDGSLLAAATTKGVQVWHLPEQTLAFTLDPSEGHGVVTWSSDGQFIATDGDRYTIDVWNATHRTKEMSLAGATTVSDGIAFSPDGTLLAATDRDSKVRIWRWRDGRVVQVISHFIPYVSSVTFSPDGQFLATGNAVTEVWRVTDAAPVHFPSESGGDVNAVAFSAGGHYLASGDAEGKIRLWDVPNKEIIYSIPSHDGAISTLAMSPNEQFIAVGGGMTNQQRLGEVTVKVWNIKDGTLRATFKKPWKAINSIVFHPDGKTLIIASADGAIYFWNMPES